MHLHSAYHFRFRSNLLDDIRMSTLKFIFWLCKIIYVIPYPMQMLFNTSNNLFYSSHLFLHDYPFLYEIFIHLERANFFFTYSTDLPTRSHTYGCIKVHLGRRNLFKPELNSTDKVYLFNFCCIFQFLNELLQIRICINIR